jgi:hypothetical protein
MVLTNPWMTSHFILLHGLGIVVVQMMTILVKKPHQSTNYYNILHNQKATKAGIGESIASYGSMNPGILLIRP